MTKKIQVVASTSIFTGILLVERSLLESCHRLIVDKHRVVVAIPRKEEVDARKKARKISMSKDPNPKKQSAVELQHVNVWVYLPKKITIEWAEIEDSPLMNDEDGQWCRALSNATNEVSRITDMAYDRWARTIRWKCDRSEIGRPDIPIYETFRRIIFWDADIREQLPHTEGPAFFRTNHIITKTEWEAAGVALEEESGPPIFYDQLYDADAYFASHRFNQSVVSCAVACETLMRIAVVKNLPNGTGTEVGRYVKRAAVSIVLDKFFPDLLSKQELDTFKDFRPKLRKLFDLRNEIMHGGGKESMTTRDCMSYCRLTHDFIEFAASKALN